MDAKLIGSACLVGILAAFVAVAYVEVLQAFQWFSRHLEALVSVPLLMAGAGVLIGLFYRFGEPGETDAVVDNIHFQNGLLDTAAALPLLPISLISIAFGGSAGPEAPLVYLTGSVGTLLRRYLHFPERSLRVLTFTGMAVGFTSLFGAPVGGTLFALEIPHRRGLEYVEATVPALLGCLVGFATFALIVRHGIGPIWHLPAYEFRSAVELAIAAGLGIGIGLCALPFLFIIDLFRTCFRAVRVPMWIKAGLGGLGLAALAWAIPDTRFFGETTLQSAVIDGKGLIGFLLLLAVGKMISVALTLASGWRGGIIIPCFLMGACLGKIGALLFPSIPLTLAVVCGMAAMNTAVMKVPLATVLVVSAMTGTYALAPIAVSAFSAFVVTGGISFLASQRERSPAPSCETKLASPLFDQPAVAAGGSAFSSGASPITSADE